MYRLRRLYLDSIGVPQNRFSDVLVELTGLDGDPVDSIVWLRNGAGKTTMLSLLLALVLPDRRDFLATRTKDRTLEDLVQGGDTSHVVAEWIDPAGHVLLTGAVYEWQGRVRPRDYNNAGKQKLKRTWWCVSPDPGVEGSTLEDLPFTLRSNGGYDRERFAAHIRDLAAAGVNAVVAQDTIGEWRAALLERRFDPDLFRYFAEVNATEGGIEQLFSKIDSPGAFVRYLLKFVIDPQRTAPVRELLAQTAAEIAKRPVYAAERDFCIDAVPAVRALGVTHHAVLDAGEQLAVVQRTAGAFKGAIRIARDAALSSAVTARRLAEERDEACTQQRNLVDSARRRRDEYRRRAAILLVATREQETERADTEAERADIELASWEAVDELVTLQVARAELESYRDALAEAAEGARPWVQRVDAAKASLAAALRAEIAKADSALADDHDRLQDEGRTRDAADVAERTAVKAFAELTTELDRCDQRVTDFERDRAELVGSGIIDEREPLDEAKDRLHRTVTARTAEIKLLEAERESLGPALIEADDALSSAVATARLADEADRELTGEAVRIRGRAAAIADRPRLRELLQTETVDLTSEGDEVAEALQRAVALADAEAIDLRAAAAADERAMAGIETDGLLPPRPVVARVLDLVRAMGVTAHSGWRYLAENVPPGDHHQVIAAHPEVLDGIVVYGDPAKIAAGITEPVDEVVVMSRARAVEPGGEHLVVLGPALARHDYAAGSAEFIRRRDRHTALSDRLASLRERSASDAAIRAEIVAFLAEMPADGMAGLEARVATAAATKATADAAVAAATAARDDLRSRQADLEKDLTVLNAEQERDTRQFLPRVVTLLARQRDEVDPARRRRGAIPAEQRRQVELETKASSRRRAADAAISRLRLAMEQRRQRRNEWAARLDSLPEPAPFGPGSLDTAEAAVAAAEQQLRENFPERDLRLAVERSEKEVQKRSGPWQARPETIRTRAEQLAISSDGADAAARLAAQSAARHRASMALQAQGTARTQLEAARSDPDAALPVRSRSTDGVEAPRDRQHARELMAEADHEAVLGQQALGELERQREAATRRGEVAEARAKTLADQTALLRQVAEADPEGAVPDDDDAVRAAVQTLTESLDRRQTVFDTAEKDRRESVERLRRWAGSDRFATLAEDDHGRAVRLLRDMFTGEHVVARVGPRAEDLVADLEIRARAIEQQLAQVEQHKHNVVVRLTDLVDEALGLLGRASRLSELPVGIGPWENRPFLTVEARRRPSREQVELRAGELVDRMVRGGRIEIDADELLWRATEAAVVDGFTASVLKPAPDQPIDRTPVEQMRRWSGGENLTASLVLFCVLARLRAERRGGSRSSATGGVVPLDNPLGKANYLPFLDLQRRVAAANGVQLVFWTGIGDLGAVTAFPRIAAMHKRASSSRPGRSYVQVDGEHSQVLDVASAARRDD